MSRRDTDTLLAAYVDGISELSVEERRRVEARLAEDPALRDDEHAARELLGALRELPQGAGPDWSALERSIHDAVGDEPPRRWLARWRWLVPGLALATAATIAIVVSKSEPSSTPSRGVNDAQIAAAAPVTPPHVATYEPATEPTASALWLDGISIELDDPTLEALELISDRGEELAADSDVRLLPMSDDWIDAVDDDSLEDIERWLEAEKLRRRKRS